MAKTVAFIDTEVGVENKKIYDIGAIRNDGRVFRSASVGDFCSFISGCEYICGHNIIHHDLKYLEKAAKRAVGGKPIDTLYLSPLLFPKHPYHHLVKDDKLQTNELNNPVSDCDKARKLFSDEIEAFEALPDHEKMIYFRLLSDKEEFKWFFDYAGYKTEPGAVFSFADTAALISKAFSGRICANARLLPLVKHYPAELAYALSITAAADDCSVTPPWLTHNYPSLDNVLKYLCAVPCAEKCPYCEKTHNIHKALKTYFGYGSFRMIGGEPLQEKAVQAAVDGKSLLAVFPTAGGKSLAFQLPAFMEGNSVRGLTVVISPLQSLMKDQVDNLAAAGITEAAAINGMLSPIERADAIERVADGMAKLLYISPEQLRSRTVEKLLLSRTVVRFVIDEAHCFSAWGQDFRVDYLYIGDFIKKLQNKKNSSQPIPVSCFTATAKKKVISDIIEYFKKKLDLDLELFMSDADRENLRYTVLFKETEDEKYNTLRSLIALKKCPAIVYVSRTATTRTLAERLTSDGFPARPFNGKMEAAEKTVNQDDFINNRVGTIVATSAFGMGVDKKDVGLVVHYDISDSLENYIQEAGRAGRDPQLQADCYVLFGDSDLDKHFMLLNMTKLSMSDIQSVWRAVKSITKDRLTAHCSALELARYAGWPDPTPQIETRVKAAVAALESAGYIKRGMNVPRIYATSILAKNMAEAGAAIDRSQNIPPEHRIAAKRIIKSLISSRSIANSLTDDAESRVDYIADTLGMNKEDVVDIVNMMRLDGLLADTMDMSAYILGSDTHGRSSRLLEQYAKLERFLITEIQETGGYMELKKLNEAAHAADIRSSNVKAIRTLRYFLTIKKYIEKRENVQYGTLKTVLQLGFDETAEKFERRIDICHFILSELYEKAEAEAADSRGETPVLFSLIDLFKKYEALPRLESAAPPVSLQDIEEALLYLSKTGALKLEGGFFVRYNAMEITRTSENPWLQFKADDYKNLDEFYKQKIRQIHIVGEYCRLMVKDYDAALQFVHDYFRLDFEKFTAKYFSGREEEIGRNITPEKFRELFGSLSESQSAIIRDDSSRYIVAAAGPGSGKTRVLVHKLASLLLMEDIKPEQLLMLTFSRSAATEFKTRLRELIGSASNYVCIKTFHSYCFDILGRPGNLDDAGDAAKNALKMIRNDNAEPGKVAKSVLVIDEAQDMDVNEYSLVCALMESNPDMRVIAVGDDDQNIYRFRGSDSRYLLALISEHGAVRYEMNENFRSRANIVALANAFVKQIGNRMKTGDITAVNKENGIVRITRCRPGNPVAALVNGFMKNYHGEKAGILTRTNEEALLAKTMLLRRGVRARLIQSLDIFSLYNLAELRYFVKELKKGVSAGVISDKVWKEAKNRTAQTYKKSTCLPNLRSLWKTFEKENRIKYLSDFEEFAKESRYEDFYSDAADKVFVSTIHKSKGKEYDSVYMLLDNCKAPDDEERREFYVGMTRAKSELYIYCTTGLFSHISAPDVEKTKDMTEYAGPAELSLHLTHRDVVLDYFKNRADRIFRLRSGMRLKLYGKYITAEHDGSAERVAKLSKAFAARLNELYAKGYRVCDARVSFIVAWKDRENGIEIPVLLPDLHLIKDGHGSGGT